VRQATVVDVRKAAITAVPVGTSFPSPSPLQSNPELHVESQHPPSTHAVGKCTYPHSLTVKLRISPSLFIWAGVYRQGAGKGTENWGQGNIFAF